MRSTAEVLHHHLESLAARDMDAVPADYSPDARRAYFLVETSGMVPASKISSCVFNRIDGGGGGSRTRAASNR